MNAGPAELGVRELRAPLYDVINAAMACGKITFVASCGRRVVGMVSVTAAEQAAAAAHDQADGDAAIAVNYAVNLTMLQDRAAARA
jgi:hypothetical protein